MDGTTSSDSGKPLEPPFAPTIPAMLHALADRYEDAEAEVKGDQRLTFRELERRSALLARGLLAQGIGKGSRIGLLMPNGPDFTVAFMAATRIGALVAMYSTLYQARELRVVLEHADIQLLMVADRYLRHDYLSRLEEAFPSLKGQTAGALALPEAPYLRSVLVWGECDRGWAAPGPASLEAAAAARPELDDAILARIEANVVPADLLCIIYTSGSTADPKGVAHSHGAMLRQTWQKSHRYWVLSEASGDRVISTRTHFWVAGFTASLMHCLLTGACLLVPKDGAPETILALIETEGATALCGDNLWLRSLSMDPTIAAAGYRIFLLSTDCAAVAKAVGAGVRYLNPERARLIPEPAQPPLELLARSYGMTETLSAHTLVGSGEVLPPERLNACGHPIPGVRLRIVDPTTRQPVTPGEVGEVLVAGYSLMQGLYKKERDETFTEDGMYATGDLGRIDARGDFYFHSRMGEMLKVHGANVAPIEVETCLNALPPIERSAVLGLPAADGGSLLVAAVQMRAGEAFDEAAVREALRGQLSSYKVPRRIFAMAAEDLPLTGSGKIRKPALAPLLAARLEAESQAASG
jgi:acyl-CoA synthetase (AMP-forming)/AMP-acid ligase II